ncbi:MAG: hypothetical protein DCC75_13785 [Proteobacteria bacterium]|nr:MAG: hypothetical protein DCC75_13785 [Pseudomonadota bacterium]
MRDLAAWLVFNHPSGRSCGELVQMYSESFSMLIENAEGILTEELKEHYRRQFDGIKQAELSKGTRSRLAMMSMLPLVFEFLRISREAKCEQVMASDLLGKVLLELKLSKVLYMERSIVARTKWEYELKLAAYQDIRRSLSDLAIKLISLKMTSPAEIEHVFSASPSIDRYKVILTEFGEKAPDIAVLCVLAKQLRNFIL